MLPLGCWTPDEVLRGVAVVRDAVLLPRARGTRARGDPGGQLEVDVTYMDGFKELLSSGCIERLEGTTVSSREAVRVKIHGLRGAGDRRRCAHSGLAACKPGSKLRSRASSGSMRQASNLPPF